MADRKVLNKYFPVDFDPAAIPSRKKVSQIKTRVMLPFTMQCSSCGDFIGIAKKFNARKEDSGEKYLTVKIWRFYIRCSTCHAEITFKTDPKNNDYTCEHGGIRNFSANKAARETIEAKKRELDAEVNGDVMQVLENRTEASKREMDEIDALEEIREINARKQTIDYDDLLERLRDKDDTELEQLLLQQEEDDEQELQEMLSTRINRVELESSSNSQQDHDQSTQPMLAREIDTFSAVATSILNTITHTNTLRNSQRQQSQSSMNTTYTANSATSHDAEKATPSQVQSDPTILTKTVMIVKKRNITKVDNIPDHKQDKKHKPSDTPCDLEVLTSNQDMHVLTNATQPPSSANRMSTLFGVYDDDSDSD